MNKLDRKLIKSQAKMLIKDKVFALFVITIIVGFLTGGLMAVTADTGDLTDTYKNIYSFGDKSKNNDNNYEDYFEKYFDNGASNGEGAFGFNEDGSIDDNPLDSFTEPEGQSKTYDVQTANVFNGLSGFKVIYKFMFVVGFALSPLAVTLSGFYVMFIRRRPDEEFKLGNELGGLFTNSFNASYIQKLVLYVLRTLFVYLWSLLLIVPGVVYSYTSAFAFELYCDYPNLKPMEALRLSKKITKGNRGELFVFDLSFIPWFLLCCVTLGLATIYVGPYYLTARALYYENFRLRAIAEGRVVEDDFLSEQEKIVKYGAPQGYNPNGYYPNAQNGGYSPNGSTYFQPDLSAQQQFTYQPPQPQAPQYPVQPNEPAPFNPQPEQPAYQEPVQEPAYEAPQEPAAPAPAEEAPAEPVEEAPADTNE